MFQTFKSIIDLILLKPKAIEEIANKPSATIDAILILFIANIASFIGIAKLIQTNPDLFPEIDIEFSLSFIFSTSSFAILFNLVIITFSYGIALAFGGHTKFINYFRVSAFAQIVNLTNIIPGLSFLSIWGFVIQFAILKHLNKLNPLQSLLTLIATFISLFALLSALS